MNPKNGADTNIAGAQWAALVQTLQSFGVEVVEMPGQPGLPDIVFTANAGTVYDGRVILSNFMHPERQPEKEFYRRQLSSMGLEIIDLPDGMTYEGAGDALWGHGKATGNTL